MRKHSDPHPFNVELDLPIQALVYTLVVSLLFLYYFLHEAFGLPSFTDSLAIMAGTFMGEGTRERLKLVLGTDNSAVNPMGVVARARARANSLLSGGVAGGFRCDGEQLVGGLWNTGNTCYQNSVLQARYSKLQYE